MAYLELFPGTIDPRRIIRHAVNIRKCLDTHFNFASVIEDATVSIQMIDNRGERFVSRRITEYCVIPSTEVWVMGNKIR